MREGFLRTVLVVALICAAPLARADVWDLGGDNDNDFGSDNELIHGLDQVHDMAAQQGGTVEDVDYYHFVQRCNASYDIVLDGLTGDVGNGTSSPALELLDSDGTTVLQTSTPVTAFGVARHLAAYCASSGTLAFTQYARVSQPVCGLSCTSDDQYHIRFFDTTALIPRFNNASGEVTFLVIRSSLDEPTSAQVVAYDATGAVIANFSLSLANNQVAVVNLSTAAGGVLNNKSGGIKILNTAPYGTLAGKAVALEPATGFTFDTPLVYQAR